MKTINPEELDRRTAYGLMISMIVPRPIAFVTTVNADGVVNAAPFSYFNGVSSQPPIVSVAIGSRRGEPKDTLRNIEQNGEFVINVTDETIGLPMVHASADFPPDVGELDKIGLSSVPSEMVAPPRIQESPIHLECRLDQIVRPEDCDTALVLGRVLRYHVQESLLDDDGFVAIDRLNPLGRLGGKSYCGVDRTFELERPTIENSPSS